MRKGNAPSKFLLVKQMADLSVERTVRFEIAVTEKGPVSERSTELLPARTGARDGSNGGATTRWD